jgi:hypothetical protein
MSKQWVAGVALGLGLTAGTIGVWTAFQQRQLELTEQADNLVIGENGAPTENVAASSSPTVPSNPKRSPQSGLLTQAENDYLYDLSQALQPSEKAKMDAAARLAVGRAIAGWAEAGAGYWELRQKFDAAYAATPFDREVYLKYAIERFAPAHVAALMEPPPPQPVVVPVRTEPIPRVEYIQAPADPIPNKPLPDRPLPDRPQVIPTPGKPPTDSAPGGSLALPPELPPEIVTPEEPEVTPEPIPAPDLPPIPEPPALPDPALTPIPDSSPLEASPSSTGSESEQG